MRSAVEKDKQLIVELLTNSFDDNQSVNYIIPQDKNRVIRIKSLMKYSFEICKLFGEVWIADNNDSCCLILYPDRKRFTLKSIWINILFITKAIGLFGLTKVLNREKQIGLKRPKHKMLYIWFIGVDIHKQNQGIGSVLLREVISKANQQNLPIYLETSNLKNVSWYQHFGFREYAQLQLNYTLYFLERLPS